MDALMYQIAGFRMKLYAPDGVLARKVLTSHEPFLLEGAEATAQEPLYTVYAGREMTPPSEDYLIDEDEMEEGIAYSFLYRKDGVFYVKVSIRGRDHLMSWCQESATAELSLGLQDLSESYVSTVALLTLFTLATIGLRTLKVHASVIEKNGRALLFLGESGTGKSTHSRLWLKYVEGATLVNDDAPIVRVMEDGEVRVFGSPWSGSTPCYKNISAPVAAFLHLYQSKENRLTKMSGVEGLASLMQSASTVRVDKASMRHSFNTVADILNKTPVYRLDCRPDIDALRLSCSLLNIIV